MEIYIYSYIFVSQKIKSRIISLFVELSALKKERQKETMAKNTGASKFRRVDVDQYNDDIFQVISSQFANFSSSPSVDDDYDDNDDATMTCDDDGNCFFNLHMYDNGFFRKSLSFYVYDTQGLTYDPLYPVTQ